MLSRPEILRAIRSAARKLKRAPTRAEFMRLTGIHYGRLIPHFPGGYRSAIRAAGLTPDPGGLRISTADLLADWARLARKKHRVPTRDEYDREGRYASASLETRFHRWSQIPAAFIEFAQASGESEKWSDVLRSIETGPMPTRGGGRRWLKGRVKNRFEKTGSSPVSGSSVPALPGRVPSGSPASMVFAPSTKISALPPPLHHMRRVTVTMLAVLIARASAQSSETSLRALVPRRVFPDRPLLGAPLGLPGFLFEPTNEMGVVLLFGMLFRHLGFIIESTQNSYPDCHAKIEVEPGRYQDVNIEFEMYSRHFRAHHHDPRRCDYLICWIHNWRSCPPHIQVIELREIVRRLKLLPDVQ